MARKKKIQNNVLHDTITKTKPSNKAFTIERESPANLPAVIGSNRQYVTPTIDNAEDLQEAFDFFNTELFDGELPHAMLTMVAKKSTNGYYAHEKYCGPNNTRVSEIALNPEIAHTRSERDTLSTLVHEMAHLWQFYFGTPSRQNASYHNREWAEKMKTVGLWPQASDGSGKETGQKMTHSIGEGGAFAEAYERYKERGLALKYSAIPHVPKTKNKKANRSKYTANDGSQVWGKPGLRIFDENGQPFIETPPEQG